MLLLFLLFVSYGIFDVILHNQVDIYIVSKDITPNIKNHRKRQEASSGDSIHMTYF